MKIRDVMTPEVATVTADESASEALERLFAHDCGILPVVDTAGEVTTVVTDRDIAIALAMRDRPASRVEISEVTHDQLVSCGPDDEVGEVLESLATHQLRRMPVVDGARLVGIVSINDLIRAARAHRGGENRPTYGDLIKSLRRTCAPRD